MDEFDIRPCPSLASELSTDYIFADQAPLVAREIRSLRKLTAKAHGAATKLLYEMHRRGHGAVEVSMLKREAPDALQAHQDSWLEVIRFGMCCDKNNRLLSHLFSAAWVTYLRIILDNTIPYAPPSEAGDYVWVRILGETSVIPYDEAIFLSNGATCGGFQLDSSFARFGQGLFTRRGAALNIAARVADALLTTGQLRHGDGLGYLFAADGRKIICAINPISDWDSWVSAHMLNNFIAALAYCMEHMNSGMHFFSKELRNKDHVWRRAIESGVKPRELASEINRDWKIDTHNISSAMSAYRKRQLSLEADVVKGSP